MRRQWLLTQPPAIAKQKGIEKPVAAAVIHFDENGCHETLEITLSRNQIPVARYFADVDEGTRWAYVGGRWTKSGIENVARMAMGKGTLQWACSKYDWDTAEDRKLADDYLGTYSVDSWESDCNMQDRRRQEEARRQKILKELDKIPVLDYEGLEEWADANFFPEFYLFTWPDGDRNRYQCTCCGLGSWRKEKFKARQVIKCPKCGHEVIVKKGIKEKERYVYVTVLQKAGDKWVERIFKCVCRWESEKTIDFFEQIRILMNEGEHFGKVYWGEYDDADEFDQSFWDRKRDSSFSCTKRSYLYPGTLPEVLPFAGLEHSGIDILAEKCIRMDYNAFIQKFSRMPYIEYMIKRGLIHLVADITRYYYVLNTGQLEIDGNRVARLKAMDGGWITYKWLRYEQDTGQKIGNDTLRYLEEAMIWPADVEKMLDTGVSVTRIANYLRKQKAAPRKTAQIWKDYLSMAQEEGINIRDDIVRLPKDLIGRHDNLVTIRTARRDADRLKAEQKKYAALDAAIASHIREAARFYWQNDEYIIIPAGKCEELMAEGRTLHHCVGASDTYMRNMADGRSWILFLRRKKELEKPYYTVEVSMKDDKVIQFYSEYDRQPDKEKIRKVLDQMIRAAKMQQTTRQTRLQVMAAAT